MRHSVKYNSIMQLWSHLTKEITTEQLQLELDVYKKMLHFFQIGDYYYVILNFATLELDLVSPNIEKVLGYAPNEIDIKTYIGLMHPDDVTWFGNFEHEASKFLPTLSYEQLFNYKVQYDLRFRKKDGTYCRLLHQSVTIQQYEKGGIFRTLCLYTDITNFKSNGRPMLSFIGLNGEPSFVDVKIGKPLIPFKEVLSKREKEVLRLIVEGKSSNQISDTLKISKQTVDRHRKNMLDRTGISSSGELIAKAFKNGWI